VRAVAVVDDDDGDGDGLALCFVLQGLVVVVVVVAVVVADDVVLEKSINSEVIGSKSWASLVCRCCRKKQTRQRCCLQN
jgi:hypothetical protein